MEYILVAMSLYFNFGFSQEFADRASCLAAIESIQSAKTSDFDKSHLNRVRLLCVPKSTDTIGENYEYK